MEQKQVKNENVIACKRKITEIIVHCTATKEGQHYTIEDVRRWHMQGNGWKDIGYHYLVYLDGTIVSGRPIAQVGAHCSGHNANSIGVCYVGGVDVNGKAKDTRTEAQKRSLVELLSMLRRSFPQAKIYGHRNFANKACPSFDAKTEYSNI